MRLNDITGHHDGRLTVEERAGRDGTGLSLKSGNTKSKGARMNNVRIDPEFRSLIPPLQPDELRFLEESLLEDGCRDALVAWAGENILLDGHHRFAICRRHGIPFETTAVELPDRGAAADWIDRNQLARRNLTPADFRLLLGRRYNRAKKSHGGDRKSKGQNGTLIEGTANSAERIGSEHGVSERTVKRTGKLASAVETVKPNVPDIEDRYRSGDVSSCAIVDAAKDPATAAENLKRPHVAHNSGNNEWYTPAEYIEAARAVMGGIDTDPASCEQANRTVRAGTFYTAEQDGLAREWTGRVWLNPPYSQPLCDRFCKAVADRYDAGRIEQAVVLVNNATDTAYFQRMLDSASAVCFPKGRIKFPDPDGKPGSPLQGQAVLYLGPNVSAFTDQFHRFGGVCHVATK